MTNLESSDLTGTGDTRTNKISTISDVSGVDGDKAKNQQENSSTTSSYRGSSLEKQNAQIKAELLRSYKDTVNSISGLYEDIVGELSRTVTTDDVSTLRERVDATIETLHLSEQDASLAAIASSELINRHERVMNVFDQYYGHYDDLFTDLFGYKSKGLVIFVPGPSILGLIVYDQEDFARLCFNLLDSSQEVSQEYLTESEEIGGFYNRNLATKKFNIGDALIFENASTKDRNSASIFEHELSHALTEIFSNDYQSVEVFKLICESTDPESIRYFIRRYYEEIRFENIDPRAKGEILAYMVSGVGADTVFDTLTENDGGLYDYYAEYKTNIKKIGTLMLTLATPENKNIFPNEQEIDKIEHQVFVDDYRNLLKRGIQAVKTLSDNGYPYNYIRTILSSESLYRWPRVVARLTGSYMPFQSNFEEDESDLNKELMSLFDSATREEVEDTVESILK